MEEEDRKKVLVEMGDGEDCIDGSRRIPWIETSRFLIPHQSLGTRQLESTKYLLFMHNSMRRHFIIYIDSSNT